MATILFDTLKFTKKLEAAGISPEQAEAFADALGEVTREDLVTRDYLDARLESLKADILKWVAGMLMAQVAVVAALVKLL